jgi:hypothetical protein
MSELIRPAREAPDGDIPPWDGDGSSAPLDCRGAKVVEHKWYWACAIEPKQVVGVGKFMFQGGDWYFFVNGFCYSPVLFEFEITAPPYWMERTL